MSDCSEGSGSLLGEMSWTSRRCVVDFSEMCGGLLGDVWHGRGKVSKHGMGGVKIVVWRAVVEGV